MAGNTQNGAVNADIDKVQALDDVSAGLTLSPEISPEISPSVKLLGNDGDTYNISDKSRNTDRSTNKSRNWITTAGDTISNKISNLFSGNNLTKVGPLVQCGGTNTYIIAGEQPSQAEQICSLPATNTNMNYMNPYMQQGYGAMPMCQPMMMQSPMMMPPFDMSSYYMWMQQQMQPQGPQINGFEDAKYAAYEAGFNVDYTEKRTAGRFADIKNMTSEERINRAKELLTGVDLTTDQKADVLSSMSPEADDFEM